MNNHIEESALERLILSPDDLNPAEITDLNAHLDNCALCREQVTKLRHFYIGLGNQMGIPPTERDSAEAEKLFAGKRLALPVSSLAKKSDEIMDAYAAVIEPYKRPLAQRFIGYIQIHPFRFTGASSLAIAAVIIAFLAIHNLKDTNPAYSRAKDEFLVVYNKEGNELWRKHIGFGYDREALQKIPGWVYDAENFLVTLDVDGDGRDETIATFGMIGAGHQRNAIYCYNDDGTVRWEYSFHSEKIFGNEVFSDSYISRSFLVGDFEKNGKIEILAIIQHDPYYPCALIKLDASNGRLIGEFWSTGSINCMEHKDIDGDGIEEIMLGAQNNGFDMASLIVLDPRYMSGCSPAPEVYTPKTDSVGLEKYYLLFPQCDFKTIPAFKRNEISGIRFIAGSSLMTTVSQKIQNTSYQLLYFFNSSMNCVRVDGEDWFVAFHKKLEEEGKLTQKIGPQYYEEMRKSVLYWDGKSFVDRPAINGKYVEAVKKGVLP